MPFLWILYHTSHSAACTAKAHQQVAMKIDPYLPDGEADWRNRLMTYNSSIQFTQFPKFINLSTDAIMLLYCKNNEDGRVQSHLSALSPVACEKGELPCYQNATRKKEKNMIFATGNLPSFGHSQINCVESIGISSSITSQYSYNMYVCSEALPGFLGCLQFFLREKKKKAQQAREN